jgi:LEA14-like dessication related protein
MFKRLALPHRLLLLMILTSLLGGCAVFRAEPPEIALAALQVDNLTLSHAILTADLDLYNPNDFNITVGKIRYALSIGGIRVAHGNSLDSIRLGSLQSGQLAVRLSTSYLNLLRLSPLLEEGKPLPYEISGNVMLGRIPWAQRNLPFRKKGSLDLSGLSSDANSVETSE